MSGYGEKMPAEGPPLTPLQVVRALRWLGELSPDEIVAAIQAGGEADVEASFPDLDADSAAKLRDQARAMTKSRLRAWNERGERQPTWLEVRALIKGLHEVLT